MSRIALLLKDISDIYVRDNFLRIQKRLNDDPLPRGQWRFFTLTFNGAVTNEKVAHGLGFKPLDIIQTSITGAGSITYNFSDFTDETLDITTTGACTVRCFVGAYKEE